MTYPPIPQNRNRGWKIFGLVALGLFMLGGCGVVACTTLVIATSKPTPSDSPSSTFTPGEGQLFTASAEPTPVMDATQLQGEILNGPGWSVCTSCESVAVTAVSCVAKSVNSLGVGSYQCLLSFEDTDQFSREILVGADGTWVSTNN